MPGRKRKPPAVRKATGEDKKHPNDTVVATFTGDAVMPEFLKRRQRAVDLWKEYAPALRLLGTLKHESTGLFASWCWLMSSFEEAPDAMPAAKIANIRALASMLGMDPSSQGKFSTPADGDKDETDQFFAGPQLAEG